MDDRIVELAADSFQEATDMLHADNVVVIREFVLYPGTVKSVVRTGFTAEEAFADAQNEVPAGAQIVSEIIKRAAKRVVLRVEGEDEEGAGKGRAEVIESVLLQKKSRKGFLGFGKSPNVYEVVISQQAVVEITFREKVRLLGLVRDYLAGDLLTCVQDLRVKDAPWEDVLQSLNPKANEDIRNLLDELLVPDRIDPVSALNIIEGKCRENEEATWHIVLQEAHRESEAERAEIREAEIARARELKERQVRLRGLDVEIADAFGFYTSINWNAKSHKEPTGIPRHTRNYDSHLPPDERLRTTIPRYSTDEEACGHLRARLVAYKIDELYLEFLVEEGLDETTATSDQKCDAILKARKQKH